MKMTRLLTTVAILLSFACSASANSSWQPYIIGEFCVSVFSDWQYQLIGTESAFLFTPQSEISDSAGLYIGVFPPFPNDTNSEDIAKLYADQYFSESTIFCTNFLSIEIAGCAAVRFETSAVDSDVTLQCLVINGDSTAILLMFYNLALTNSEEAEQFDSIIEKVYIAEEDYFESLMERIYDKNLSDLIIMQRTISAAMWYTSDWQSVTIPQGIYEIGTDIPEGHWTISAADGAYTHIVYGKYLDETKTNVMYSTPYTSFWLCSPSHHAYDKNSDAVEFDIDMRIGYYMEISSGSAIITPYTGKPPFDFK